MADTETTPLTQDERAELEALRAEKARREEEARARAERAELEALRAEQARADAEQAVPAQSTPQPAAAQPAPQAAPAPKKRPAPAPEPDEPAEKTFGVRMVTSDTVDKDGIPTMPMAQKVLIAVAFVGVIAFCIYYIL